MLRMRAAWLVFAPLLASCSKCSGNVQPASTAPSTSASVSSEAAAPSTRCGLVGQPSIFGALPTDDAGNEGPVAYGAELGGAAADDKGFVVGVRSAGLSGSAHVIEIPIGGGAIRNVAKLPDGAHAPLVAIGKDGARLYGHLTLEEKTRTFHAAGGAPFNIIESKDESEATAFLAGLVAWDDIDEKAGIGRILTRTASSKDEEAISPKESDAAWPAFAVAPAGDRAVLLWLSERPEQEGDTGGEPSQSLAFRWLEGAVIDVTTGKRVGPVRALTALDGHAQTFSAIWGDAGLIVVVRDDPRPADGDGGELIALRSTIDPAGALSEPARLPIADKEVAPGVASLLPRPGGALVAWLGQDGTAHLTPAFTIGSATIEPTLRDRRVIATRDDRALTSRIVGSGLELAIARCAP